MTRIPSVVDITLSRINLSRVTGNLRIAALDLVSTLHHAGIETVDVGSVTDPYRFSVAQEISLHLPQVTAMVMCRFDRKEITHAYEALKASGKGRIGLSVPTSLGDVKERRWESYTDLLLTVDQHIGFGSRLGLEVDILLETSTTADSVFLSRLAQRAVSAGAAGVTLVEPGVHTTDSFANLVQRVVKAIPTARVGVRCSDRLGRGVSSSIQAVEEGAREMGTVITPWSHDMPCPSLHQLSALGYLSLEPDYLVHLTDRVKATLGVMDPAYRSAAAGNMHDSTTT